jgi:hypothetical protein
MLNMPKAARRVGMSAGALLATAIVLFVPPAPSVATGQTSAAPIRVRIDVKPGDEPTSIEPKRGGMVPIAILTTKEFDATQVDSATVRAGATGTEAGLFRASIDDDVNNDGTRDMMLLFRVQEMGLECGGKSITVKGKTQKGQAFEGTESVTMAGCQ